MAYVEKMDANRIQACMKGLDPNSYSRHEMFDYFTRKIWMNDGTIMYRYHDVVIMTEDPRGKFLVIPTGAQRWRLRDASGYYETWLRQKFPEYSINVFIGNHGDDKVVTITMNDPMLDADHDGWHYFNGVYITKKDEIVVDTETGIPINLIGMRNYNDYIA